MGTQSEGTGVGTLFSKIDELVRQGNVRRIVVSDRGGRKMLDIPVNAGLVAAVVAPMLTAAGTALALVGGWQIQVEHHEAEVVPGDADETPGATATPDPATTPGPAAAPDPAATPGPAAASDSTAKPNSASGSASASDSGSAPDPASASGSGSAADPDKPTT